MTLIIIGVGIAVVMYLIISSRKVESKLLDESKHYDKTRRGKEDTKDE